MKNNLYKNIPGVDTLLLDKKLQSYLKNFGKELITYSIRSILNEIRSNILKSKSIPDKDKIIQNIINFINNLTNPSLKKVINATGIIIHTNLGRAPLGDIILDEIKDSITGYSNLEFDLNTAKRGKRITHTKNLITYLTNSEDAIIVNNNAAALMFVLNTFANKKEVIISRGELIEIGGSFRIPEILKASNAKMIEVGTTNRTRISDYEKAITSKTKIILKAHKSNYSINGFTEEVNIKELSNLAKKHNILMVYDIGSGLIKKHKNLPLQKEPTVQSSINDGASLVTFSTDKLLGSSQGGIICGKKEYIQILSKKPMMRALRAGKLTIAYINSALRCYLDEKKLVKSMPIFSMLNKSNSSLHKYAKKIAKLLNDKKIPVSVIKNNAHSGGGTLPDLNIDSYAILIDFSNLNSKNTSLFAEKMYKTLLKESPPILGILRQGNLLFDVLTIFEKDIEYVTHTIHKIYNYIKKNNHE